MVRHQDCEVEVLPVPTRPLVLYAFVGCDRWRECLVVFLGDVVTRLVLPPYRHLRGVPPALQDRLEDE